MDLRTRKCVSALLATTAATLVAAGTAGAAPPQSYDEEVLSKFNAANSVETIRHLAVDIGPRLRGTPQEREAAEYLAGILQTYGFETTIQSWGPVGTANVAKVTSPNRTLNGTPNWQMSSSTSGKVTGNDDAAEGDVIYAGNGLSATNFPADTAGKVVMMDYTTNAANRNTAVNNAVT